MTNSLPANVLLLVLTIASFSVSACGSTAEPATGPIADQVAAAMKSGTEDFDNSEFSALLKDGVRDGLVNYDFFKKNRVKLDGYLESVAGANLASLEGSHLQALLMNAYNAYTITSILDNLPLKSIRDIDGVWDTKTHKVGGLDLTLDNIEHNVLRPLFKDPRVHVAVNCASQSCAPLPNWAFEGDELEEQLSSWTEKFFANPKYLELDGDKLSVSKLLDWYGDDFTTEGWEPRADSLATFIAERAPQEIREFIENQGDDIKLRFKDYDWSLNRAK